ncbi:MAG: tetratricopeptide repeat protein [Magnetococcus sp. YQC-9]
MSDTPSTELRTALADVAHMIEHKTWSQALERLLDLKKGHPGHPHVLHLLGVVKRETGDLRGALESLSQAVAALPDNAVFQLDLALLLKKRGTRLPAIERLTEAIRLDPGMAIARVHLGDLYMDLGRIDEAIDCFTAATRLKPGLIEAWINLGLCQKSQNRLQDAFECFENAVLRQPEHAEAHVNLALSSLMNGDYPQGWREFEWRFKLERENLLFPNLPLPRWHGESLKNRTLVLVGEQGFGDMIQFIRFAAPLAERGARVVALVPTPLMRLFESAPGVARVLNHTDFGEPIDCQIPILSLPGVLGTTIETIPATPGYLKAPEILDPALNGLLAGPGDKIGLIWSGKPLHANDPLRRRSCTPADLAPLARLPNARLFSLQKPDPAGPPPAFPDGMEVTPLDGHLNDFAATAAIMNRLDRIVTIDTAAAHLAGALGRPVATLLPCAPDWRWGNHQDHTPWYDSMRLFRQSRHDRWEEPVQQLVRELTNRV